MLQNSIILINVVFMPETK